jgi:hypothetical protein
VSACPTPLSNYRELDPKRFRHQERTLRFLLPTSGNAIVLVSCSHSLFDGSLFVGPHWSRTPTSRRSAPRTGPGVRTQRETCFHLCLEIGDKVCGDGERRESAGGMRLRTRRYGRYGHHFLAGMNPAWYASRNWGRDLIETTHPCSRYFDHHHWGSPTYNVRPCTRCYWADH